MIHVPVVSVVTEKILSVHEQERDHFQVALINSSTESTDTEEPLNSPNEPETTEEEISGESEGSDELTSADDGSAADSNEDDLRESPSRGDPRRAPRARTNQPERREDERESNPKPPEREREKISGQVVESLPGGEERRPDKPEYLSDRDQVVERQKRARENGPNPRQAQEAAPENKGVPQKAMPQRPGTAISAARAKRFGTKQEGELDASTKRTTALDPDRRNKHVSREKREGPLLEEAPPEPVQKGLKQSRLNQPQKGEKRFSDQHNRARVKASESSNGRRRSKAVAHEKLRLPTVISDRMPPLIKLEDLWRESSQTPITLVPWAVRRPAAEKVTPPRLEPPTRSANPSPARRKVDRRRQLYAHGTLKARDLRAPQEIPPSEAGPEEQPETQEVGKAVERERRAPDATDSPTNTKVVLRPSPRVLGEILGGPWVDHLPEVEEEGPDNLLSTARWRHAPFFQRVHRQIAQHWYPLVRAAGREPGFEPYTHRDRLTTLQIVLDSDGRLINVFVLRSSGAEVFDNIALQAVRRAAPFPNPPRGLIDSVSNYIDFNFGFNVDMVAPFLRMRRMHLNND